MKKIVSIMAALAICAAYTGCENGDLWDANDKLEGRVDALEESMATLQQLLQKLEKQVTIDRVDTTADGCTIYFSDGTTARIHNGADGKNGVDGTNGTNGDSLFKDVTENENEVVFTLSDGRVIVFPRTADFTFEIECDAVNEFLMGRSRTFAVNSSHVSDYMITHPCGWQASFDGSELTVTAPSKDNAAADAEGEIAVMVVSATGTSKIVKMQVRAIPFRLRVLTFEDGDYRGSEGDGYWSSLIDPKEYNGDMLYGGDEYTWFDEGNTNLFSGLAEAYGDYMFWYGGCVVSNYTLDDVKAGSYTTQLSVLSGPNGNGGRNGSANFGIAFDGSSMMGTPTAQMLFYDGTERVIDHMYITTTAYTLNSLMYGDGFSKPAGDDGWFAVTATGYNLDEEKTGETTFYLCRNGKIVNDWEKWDLSSLGEVLYVTFYCTGSDMSAYGLNTPAYFAFDDVAVRFDE